MLRKLIKDEKADAVVEATILFPIIIMIFAVLVLLAMYLPQRANLQRAAQYAAVIAANIQSDTGYTFNEANMTVTADYGDLPNVYARLFDTYSADEQSQSDQIIRQLMDKGFIKRDSTIAIDCKMNNYVVYKIIEINAVETVNMPVSLKFVGFGDTMTVEATARCTVQNSDEFIRNIDIAADLVTFLDEKLGVSDKLFAAVSKVKGFFKN